MPNDLQIASITLPPTVTAPCPTTVAVDVINLGPDAATLPSGLTVCLDIGETDRPSVHYSLHGRVEESAFGAGAIRTFTFRRVQFPCATSAFVTATADCDQSVPDNIRSNPSLTIPVPKVDLVPWLWTTLRVGLKDSTGFVTWQPSALCPGAELVAEARVRNAGCAVAVASITRLELLDDTGQSVFTKDQSTPAIAPGATRIVQFATTIPATVATPGLAVRACADQTQVVTNQCDRQRACGETRLPLSAAGPPKLTLSAARPIFPGEPVPLSWRVQNLCSDLGAVTARLISSGVELYKSAPVAVGLQDVEKGEDLLVGPPAASLPAFYKTGTKQVTLEVTGTGNDPGPYTTAAAVTVVPEPVSGTWTFTLPAPATVVDWKAAYTVAGRFTNPTHATVTPTSIALDETSIAVQPTQRNASPLLGALAPGAVGTEAWSLVQTWSWLIPGVWIPSGPQGAVFTYTVTFAAQDEYGNAYPAATSPALAVTVRVSTKKLALAATALAATEIAVTLLALAFLALAGYYTAIAAPALFAAAGAAYGAASGAGAGALDPPVPDFDYHRVVPTRPPAMPDELVGDPALDPLAAVFALLSRTAELDARMSATEARLIGARIDREDAAIHLQSDEYRDLRDSLLTTLEYIPVAVLAAVESEEANRLLRPPGSPEPRKVLSMWSSERLPAKLRRAARAGGLDAEVLKNLEQAFRSPEFVLRPIEEPLREISAAAPNLAIGVRDEAEAVLRGVA